MALGAIIIGCAAIVNGMLLAAYYINSNSFPQPLSEVEEQLWIKAMENGDPEARDVLIEHNLRLVAHIAKKFEGKSEDRDDLISIGTIGLIKAVQTFNESKGIKLSTYASRCIENEILMFFRANRRNRNDISLYDSVGTDREGNSITLLEVLGTDGDIVVDEVENRLEFQNLLEQLKHLTKREKQVISWRFGLEDGLRRTQKEVAEELGISRSYVSRIEKKAVKKLIKCIRQ
ncbi:MAG: RNA polymerase sporulation sigma factor SigK [Clostridiales bacterium]